MNVGASCEGSCYNQWKHTPEKTETKRIYIYGMIKIFISQTNIWESVMKMLSESNNSQINTQTHTKYDGLSCLFAIYVDLNA